MAADRSLADASKDALSRGVPIKKAMDGNNLIVFAMNGQPLSNIHGGPVRLVIPGWPGSVSAKWFNRLWVRDKYHDGPGMGATSYRVAIKPMVPGDKPADGNFRDLESMPVRSIITSPANGAKLAAGTKEVKLRGAAWAGDLTVRPRRHLDRLRRDVDARQARQAEEQVRLAALDRERHACRRTAISKSGRAAPTPRARCSRTSPATGIRKATAAIPCTGSRCWSADADNPHGGQPRAGRHLALLRRRLRAGAAVCAARREPRGLSGRSPAATTRSTPAPPATASSSWPSRA